MISSVGGTEGLVGLSGVADAVGNARVIWDRTGGDGIMEFGG